MPPTVRLLSRVVGTERTGIMVAWITVIHQVGGAAAAYLGGVLRISFGTYLEAFAGFRAAVLAAALMALSSGPADAAAGRIDADAGRISDRRAGGAMSCRGPRRAGVPALIGALDHGSRV